VTVTPVRALVMPTLASTGRHRGHCIDAPRSADLRAEWSSGRPGAHLERDVVLCTLNPTQRRMSSRAGSFVGARSLAAAALAAMSLAACGATPQVTRPADAADALYIDGMQQMHSGNHLEAAQTFANVLKMPAYLTVTATARLRLGDALASQGKYEEAIEVFEGYLRRHEGTRDVAYAAWRVAECHAKMVPEEFWLMPPIREMDLSSADKARYHLERFVRTFPTAPYVAEALRLRDQMLDLELAQHRYVIDFYVKRKQPLGVAWRSHEMMRRFPLRAHTAYDYKRLALAYEELHWRKRARDLQKVIARRWPGTAESKFAADRAAAIDGEIARLRAGGAADAEMPTEPPPTAAVEPELLGGKVREEG
jgi:outer membrane protein assembly factor BamD